MSRKNAGATGSRAAAGRADAPPDRETQPTGPVPEMIRRMATLGLSGFFMTEGAIRKAFGDTIPQDWLDFASEQSERTRKDVIDRLAQEMTRQLADTDPAELLSKFLSGHTIEIEAKLRLTPRKDNDDGPGLRTRFEVE